MRFLALFCALFFASVPLVHAEEKITKAICKPGTVRTVSDPVFGGDGGKATLNKITGTNNFCVNERVTLTGMLSNELVNEATCICRNQAELEQIGCSDGQRQPIVSIEISKKITNCTSDKVVISKCAADPEEAYEEACKSGADLSYLKSGDPKNISIAEAGAPRSMPSLGIHDGSETLKKALTASGVSEEKAQEIVAQNRQAGIDYVRALAGGDGEAAKIRAEALGLNANLSSSAQEAVTGVIREEQSRADPLAGKSFYETGAYQSGSTGFDTNAGRPPMGGPIDASTGLPTQCGVGGYAGNFMLAESGCNRAPTNAINPYVGGAHHYLCSTWQGDVASTGLTQYRDCQYRFDPAASSQVVNARYAQHEQAYGGQCKSAGVSVSSCMYAIHVFGEGGFRNILAAQQQNPSASAGTLCGSAVSAAACTGNQAIFTNGGTVQGVFGELDRRLTGNAVVSGYGRGTGVSIPTGQTYSPFGGFTSNSQALVYNSTSPFGQVNVAGDLMQPLAGGLGMGQMFNNRPPQYQPPYQQSPVQQGAQSSVQQPVQQPISGTTSTTQALDPNPPKAVATVIIQPKSVAVGKSFTVSWTSVGTKSDCVLTADGKVIARDGSGTKRVTMQIAATVRYTLSCTALSGEKVEVYETVTVI